MLHQCSLFGQMRPLLDGVVAVVALFVLTEKRGNFARYAWALNQIGFIRRGMRLTMLQDAVAPMCCRMVALRAARVAVLNMNMQICMPGAHNYGVPGETKARTSATARFITARMLQVNVLRALVLRTK